jgi:archaellum component FlaG (FlaF/FlaG flagellin family)
MKTIKTIYIRLIDEGTEVFRPTKAEVLQDGFFKVLPTANYDPDDECWEFVPGSVVRCISRKLDGDEVLIAVAMNYDGGQDDLSV